MTVENEKDILELKLNKKTRWDRISKNYSSNHEISSETVRKFLDLNYVNEKSMKDFCGSSENSTPENINPQILMDLRHGSIRKKKEFRLGKIQYKDIQLENIKQHNSLIEMRMIDNELTKYKLKIKKFSAKKKSQIEFNKGTDLDGHEADEDDDDEKLLQTMNRAKDDRFAYKNSTHNIIVEQLKNLEPNEWSYEEESVSSTSFSDRSSEKMVQYSAPDQIKVLTFSKPKTPRFSSKMDSLEIVDNIEFDPEDNDVIEYVNQHDLDCSMCCSEAYCPAYEYQHREFDLQSFHSMPNISDADVENMMKISKFQSMLSVNESEDFYTTPAIEECACCITTEEIHKTQEIVIYNQKIVDAETEKMLIIKRMEMEEKNYEHLIVMNKSHSHNDLSESDKITHDLNLNTQIKAENMAKELLHKYFQQWLQRTTIQKILKTNAFTNEDRVKKINGFLNKIRLEQNKSITKNKMQQPLMTTSKKVSGNSTSKSLPNTKLKKDYEQKLKNQQDVIELQKLKLQRQERLITEMKMLKFSEMLKESKNEIKKELMNAKRGNVKLRIKARCIQLTADIPLDPEEEDRRMILAQGLEVPKFLAKMQERAAERNMRHEGARERRLKLEHEKEELKTAAEIARKMEDEEVRKKRMLEMRDKRRHEKNIKIFREQERQKYMEDMAKVKAFYARKLLQQLGFKAFELLIRLKRSNHKKAINHRRRMCMMKHFILWHQNTKAIWDYKKQQANELYHVMLIKHQFAIWRHVRKIHQSKFLVAVDWYEVKITQKIVTHWALKTKQNKILEIAKLRGAEAHYNCQLKWKIVDHWRRLPAILRIEKETDIRRQKWRLKIWDMLPDYKPTCENGN
ncbi:unnamed protein product [Diamesa serratosioi]